MAIEGSRQESPGVAQARVRAMRESVFALKRNLEKVTEDVRRLEQQELNESPELRESYDQLISFENERDKVRKRLAYLRPMYSSVVELVRDDPAGEYRDLLTEVTLSYNKTFRELQAIADSIGSWGQSFSANKAQGDVPIIIQKQLSHLSDGFNEEIEADAEIQRMLEDFPEARVESASDDTLPPKQASATIEIKRPDNLEFTPIHDGAEVGRAKLSAIREPYLEAKRQYRDIQHTLTEEERREFRSKLAVLASSVREAEDRHYNAFFSDEIAPVPAPPQPPVPVASLASASTRPQVGGKVSGSVWRRVAAGVASSLKLNDE